MVYTRYTDRKEGVSVTLQLPGIFSILSQQSVSCIKTILMFQKAVLFSILTLCILSFSDCATLIHGSKQTLFLTCEPKIASVYVDGAYIGETPMRTWLKRGKSHQLKLQLAGYKPFEAELKRKIDGWTFGNIAFGWLVGLAVDAATGSMYRLSPRDIYPELSSLPVQGSDVSSRELSILVTLHPDPQWEKIGQLSVMK